MTHEQANLIETTGIIPNDLLDEYLAGKNLTKPKVTMWDLGLEEEAFQSRHKEYKANMNRAQKAANEQLNGRKK